jgi:hypothetical protein
MKVHENGVATKGPKCNDNQEIRGRNPLFSKRHAGLRVDSNLTAPTIFFPKNINFALILQGNLHFLLSSLPSCYMVQLREKRPTKTNTTTNTKALQVFFPKGSLCPK